MLERSIAKSVEDGWEYVSKNTYSKPREPRNAVQERGVRACVPASPWINCCVLWPIAAPALLQPVAKKAALHDEEPQLRTAEKQRRAVGHDAFGHSA